jgi:hypothetical protein
MPPEPGAWDWYKVHSSTDKAWADRQAEHYKIDIMYEEVK